MCKRAMRKYMKAQLHTMRHMMSKLHISSTEWIAHYASSFREIYNYKHLLYR